VQPPALHDGTRGYILSRALEADGGPVAFAFAGDPQGQDGSKVTLHAPLLKKSLNYQSLARGNSYPLFYDTLFAALRTTLADAAVKARTAKIIDLRRDGQTYVQILAGKRTPAARAPRMQAQRVQSTSGRDLADRQPADERLHSDLQRPTPSSGEAEFHDVRRSLRSAARRAVCS
jgi:hypothetical protein